MKLKTNKTNLQSIGKLVQYAFNKTESVVDKETFLSVYQHAYSYGQIHDSQVTSYVMVDQFESQFYDSKVKMAGIAYVSSYPEYRGDGGVSDLFHEIIPDLYENDYVISNLAPFSEHFYRQFGYENTIFQKHYRLSADSFRTCPSERSGSLKRGAWQDLEIREKVLDIYEKSLASGSEVNCMARAPWWWERMDIYYPNRLIAVAYDEAKTAVGYLIYRMAATEFLIDELVYLNGFAMRKLLSFVKSHVSSFEYFVYSAGLNEVIEYHFAEREGIEINEKAFMMSRIINFEKLIEKIPFRYKGALVFEVLDDELCPWNNGKWVINVDDNQVSCQKALVDEKPNLSGHIQAWTMLILGNLSLKQATLLGLLTVDDLVKAEKLFPNKQTSFYDYF